MQNVADKVTVLIPRFFTVMITPLLTTAAITIASLTTLIIFKFLDMFEKEPWWALLNSFLFGAVVFWKFDIIFCAAPYKNSTARRLSRIAFSWFVSFIIIIASQIGLGASFLILMKKYFDSITDYILYFSCLGIGFDWSERITTNFLNTVSIVDQNLMSIIFRSAFTAGSTSPFLMAGVGLAAFFVIHGKRFAEEISLATILAGCGAFLVGNIAFYGTPFIFSISNPHIIRPINNFVPLLQALSQNVTLVLVTAAIGTCVIFDLYLLNRFRDTSLLRLDSYGLSTEALGNIRNMINV